MEELSNINEGPSNIHFKTFAGNNYYYNVEYVQNIKLDLCFDIDYSTYDEKELLQFITDSTNKKFCAYIVTNSLTNIIDQLIEADEKNISQIQHSICSNTSDIDLYKKYCINYFDHVHGFILSMCYEKKPSDLTRWIELNYNLDNPYYYDLCFYLEGIGSEDLMYEMLSYIIEKINLKFSLVYNHTKLFELMSEPTVVKILKMLYSNETNDKSLKMLIVTVVECCSINNVKYFIEKYDVKFSILSKAILYTEDYDTFVYMINLIDPFKLKKEHFNGYPHIYIKLHKNLNIMKWLYANDFIVRPCFFDMTSDVIMEIIKDVIVVGDYEYLTNNTYHIIRLIDSYDELFELIPIKIFKINRLFDFAIFYEKYDLIKILINNGIQFDSSNDRMFNIVYDLKILKKDSILKYIEDNPEIFNYKY